MLPRGPFCRPLSAFRRGYHARALTAVPFETVVPLAAASAAAGPFVAGLLLGVGAAVPPGPVNLEIARRATRGGTLAGAAVGFGAVTVDVILALLLSLGVLALLDRTRLLRVPISLVGVVLLAYLGLGALRNFARGRRSNRTDAMEIPAPIEPSDRATPLRGYATGLLICGTSPYQAAFWLTGVPAILNRSGAATTGHATAARLALCGGVFAATLTWVVCFSSVVAFARSLDRRRWLVPAMDLVGGTLLLGFAVASALRLAAGVLSSAPPVGP